MNEILELFKEAERNKVFDNNYITVVRRNGKIYDYVLPHEPIREHEFISVEPYSKVFKELETY